MNADLILHQPAKYTFNNHEIFIFIIHYHNINLILVS